MKKIALMLIMILVAGCLGQKPAGLEWETDAQTALEKSKAEKKSLLIFFYDTKAQAIIGGESVNPSDWMEKNVFSDPKISELFFEKFVLVRLDVDIGDNKALARSYGGSIFPFFIVVGADGNVCNTFSGANNAEAFRKKLEGCYA